MHERAWDEPSAHLSEFLSHPQNGGVKPPLRQRGVVLRWGVIDQVIRNPLWGGEEQHAIRLAVLNAVPGSQIEARGRGSSAPPDVDRVSRFLLRRFRQFRVASI